MPYGVCFIARFVASLALYALLSTHRVEDHFYIILTLAKNPKYFSLLYVFSRKNVVIDRFLI